MSRSTDTLFGESTFEMILKKSIWRLCEPVFRLAPRKKLTNAWFGRAEIQQLCPLRAFKTPKKFQHEY